MDASNLNKIESLLFSGTTENLQLAKLLAKSQDLDLSTFFEDVENIYYYLVKDDYDLLSKEERFLHVMNLIDLDIQGTFPVEHFFKYLSNIKSLSFSEKHRFIFEEKHVLDLSLESFRQYSKLKNIENLFIENSILRELPDWIFSFEELKTLWLSCKKLKEIPSAIGKFSHLESLTISSKKELKLPKSMSKLTALKNVTIQEGAIPSGLSHIPYIKLLRISDPSNNLKKLKQLRGYSLDFHSFKAAKHFAPFSNFEIITISIRYNKIWRKQPNLADLKSVKQLTFNYSLGFPKAIVELKNLERLELYGAIIKKVPAQIKNLNKLQEIHFRACYLAPSALKRLKEALPSVTININEFTELSNPQTSFSQLVVPEWWSKFIDYLSNYRYLKEHKFVWINSISFITFLLLIILGIYLFLSFFFF